MSVPLPPNIASELGPLAGALAKEGFGPVACEESACFGNFTATFSNGKRSVVVCRDRGQFHVEGERKSLEPAGLWRSFHGSRELLSPLVLWLRGAA